MNEQNLIPFSKRTEEEQRRIRSMGGSVKSPAKKIAAKLRWLKHKGLTEENAKHLHELMTDSDMTDLDILTLLESIRSKAGSVVEKGAVAKLYMEWRRMRHGEKIHVENTTSAVNLDLVYSLSTDEIATIASDDGKGEKPSDGPMEK